MTTKYTSTALPSWVVSSLWAKSTVKLYVLKDKPEDWKAVLDALMAGRGFEPIPNPPSNKATWPAEKSAVQKALTQRDTVKIEKGRSLTEMPNITTELGRHRWCDWYNYYTSVFGKTQAHAFANGYMQTPAWRVWEDFWDGKRGDAIPEIAEYLVEKYDN